MPVMTRAAPAGAIELASSALVVTGLPRLASWVSLHTEICRDGSVYAVALNRREGTALQLTPSELDVYLQLASGAHPGTSTADGFMAELIDARFFADSLPPPRATRRQSVQRMLRERNVAWGGADRFVRAVYRSSSWLFHPAAVALQVLLALAGVAALLAAVLRPGAVELHVQPGQLPLLLTLNFVAIAIHELGHALVLVRGGASVRTAGLRLHLGVPAAYVETVDGLLLARRTRLIQAAAGPWAEWLVASLAGLVLLAEPDPLLRRFVLLNAITIASNLLPFVGLDGSWLLADLLRVPDLAARSRIALDRLHDRRIPAKGERLVTCYALVDRLIAAVLLATAGWFWWQTFGALAGRLAASGPGGWTLLAAIAIVVIPPLLRPITGLPASAIADRLRFRSQRRWRVQATRWLASSGIVSGLSPYQLGVIAGALHLLPAGSSSTQHHPQLVVVPIRLAGRRRYAALHTHQLPGADVFPCLSERCDQSGSEAQRFMSAG